MCEGKPEEREVLGPSTLRTSPSFRVLLLCFNQVKGTSLLKIAGEGVGSHLMKSCPCLASNLEWTRKVSVTLITKGEWWFFSFAGKNVGHVTLSFLYFPLVLELLMMVLYYFSKNNKVISLYWKKEKEKKASQDDSSPLQGNPLHHQQSLVK